MNESVRGSCDLANYRSMCRNLRKFKICSNAGSKRIDSKIEQNIKEQQALHHLAERLDNAMAPTQKIKSIKRTKQLAADLDHIDSAIKSRQAQVAHLKLQILGLDNETAKFPTVQEKSNAEKQMNEIEARLLDNNRKKNSLKVRANQLEAVVSDMRLKRQNFLNIRKVSISKWMSNRREIDEIINSYSTITTNEPVQPTKNHLQGTQSPRDTTKLNRMLQKLIQYHNVNAITSRSDSKPRKPTFTNQRSRL